MAAVALMCFGMPAIAGGAPGDIRQRDAVAVGIDHLPPPYAAGKKFRTPENIDAVLVAQIAQQWHVSPTTVKNATENRAGLLKSGKADIVLTVIAKDDPLYRTTAVIPTGYVSGPLAIMRSDTDIRNWQQLKGRTVCIARDGRYAGTLARQFGATEIVYPSVTDSLLALRTGGCDTAVHDSLVLEELLKLPEWKNFSARLPVEQFKSLIFAVPAGDAALQESLKQTIREWEKTAFISHQIKTMARNIAFEVYLDQDVPDCH